METNPLRGLLGVSSPQPVEQRVAPQPTEPTENVYFEIPSGMVEKLLANPFAGGGTLHPIYTLYMWMKFVDYLRDTPNIFHSNKYSKFQHTI